MSRRVLLLTGPSGAGKSVTAVAFAASRRSTTAVLDQDLVRTFIKSGFARPDTDWGPEAERQWLLSRQICLDAVARYTDAAIDCVVDVYAPGPDDVWRSAMPAGIRFDTIVLRPPIEVAAARNSERSGITRLDPTDHARNYESFEGEAPVPGALVIDNSRLTVDEVVSALAQRLDWQ